MKRLWRKREHTTPELILSHRGLTVTHIVEKKPDPKPVSGHLMWTNQNGERWSSPAFPINGQMSYPIDIPIAWLTGREEDIAKLPLTVILMLEY